MFNGSQYNNKLSSGTRWGDALVGLSYGLDKGLNNSDSKGNFYGSSQWLGDGLANTKVAFLPNPKYEEGKDKSLARALGLSAALKQNRFSYPTNTTGTSNGKIMDNNYTYGMLKNILPSDNINSGTIFGNDYNQEFRLPTYSEGGRFGSFGNSVLDFLGDNYGSDYSKGI